MTEEATNTVLRKVLGLFVILFAVIFPHLVPLPLSSYSIVVILVVWGFMKSGRVRFSDIGFSKQGFKKQALLYGVGAGLLAVSFSQLIFFPLVEWSNLFPETDVEFYDQLSGNIGFYVLMLCMGWIIGGLYEEIVFHGFIFHQLKKTVTGKYSSSISFAITGVLFGLYHLQLGPADALNAFIIGMFYHFLVIRFKGNLWYSIICHGTYNSVAITILYLA